MERRILSPSAFAALSLALSTCSDAGAPIPELEEFVEQQRPIKAPALKREPEFYESPASERDRYRKDYLKHLTGIAKKNEAKRVKAKAARKARKKNR